MNSSTPMSACRLIDSSTRGIRSRQGTQAPRRKVGIVAVVRVDIAARMIPSVGAERIIGRAHPTRFSGAARFLPRVLDLVPCLEQVFRLATARSHVTVAPLGNTLHDRGNITADQQFGPVGASWPRARWAPI